MPFSGGLAVYAAPDSPANKVIGVGFDGPIDIHELARIEAKWRDLLAAELRDTLLDYLQTPGLTHYLARLNGRAVGAASLRLDDGIAWLAGADTPPAAATRASTRRLSVIGWSRPERPEPTSR